MNILHTLTIRYAQKHKARTLLTLCSLIFSITLISCLLLFQASYHDYQNRQNTFLYGNQDIKINIDDAPALFTILTKEDIQKQNIVYDDDTMKNQNGDIIQIKSISSCFTMQAFQIWEGNMPSKENDVMISQRYAQNHDIHINDQIQMDFTKSKLHVTGIYTPDYIASNSSTTDEILIYDTTEKTDGTLFIQLKDTSKNKLQEIAKQFPYAITPVSSNHTPLDYLFNFLILFISLFVFLFMKNVFQIMLQEKRQYLGMLKSIGITNHQLFLMYIFEAFYYVIFSVPIAIFIALLLVHTLLENFSTAFLKLQISPVTFRLIPDFRIFSFIFIALFLIIYLVQCILHHQMKKASIIELIKQSTNSKTPKYKRTFNTKYIEKVIGKRYAKQSKSSHHAIITALFISFTLIFTSSYLFTIAKQNIQDQQGIHVRFRNTLPSQYENAFSIFHEYSTLAGVNSYQFHSDFQLDQITISNDLRSPQASSLFSSNSSSIKFLVNTNNLLSNDDNFYLQNDFRYHDTSNSTKTMQFFDTNIHTITIQIPYIHNNQFLYDTLELPLTPANDTSQFHVIDVYQNDASFCPEIYLSFHKMQEISTKIASLDIPVLLTNEIDLYGDSEIIQQALTTFQKKYPDWVLESSPLNFDPSAMIDQLYYQMIASISLLICMICFMNILCMMINQMLMRRKDNVLMLSIGMETRQIYRMLFFENISMILRTYLISIPISIALSYLFYINFLNASISFSYSVSIIIYTFIPLLIMMLMILYTGYCIMIQKNIDV